MRLPFGKKFQPGWLAVVQHGERVDVAHVVPRDRRPQLLLCESYRAADAAALQRLGKTLKAEKFRTTTLLAPGEYQTLSIESPGVPREEFKAALSWRVKEQLDFDLDEAVVDGVDMPGSGNANRAAQAMAVAARKHTVEARVKPLRDADFKVEAVDIPEFAQRNLGALFEQTDRGLAMLAFDADGGLLTATYQGELYLARRLDITFAQLVEAKGIQRQQVFDRVALEVTRSLDHFDRQFGFITVTKLVVAPLPDGLGLLEHLGQSVYVPVEQADLSRVMDIAGASVTPAEQANHWRVIGAALRAEAA
jgi:MSHA biogenesis protein MshI